MPLEAASKDDVERVEGKVDKVLLLLNGNGTPGLFTRLVLLENWREAQENAQKETGQTVRGLLLPALRDFVLIFVAMLVTLIVSHSDLFGMPR